MDEFDMSLFFSELQNSEGLQLTWDIIQYHSIFLYKSCTKAAQFVSESSQIHHPTTIFQRE
jgi:hypothetical protein